ncbi:UNVERIFIED_CONTAM: protein FAR1-RELATED SEQUENCE 3 [Sesamum radiatum]|uniref:Protein FAR1-RELATED SEQUENCE 3 n=1 Tax=Sesamum radiatum TaxID=300843 RepID=A0AAW2TI93_SESRA
MTWTVENKSATPANRVAIITLKLQDYTKCPTNEMEVKFQLTKDTLEAVLRSMAYINEQLSRFVGLSSGPLQKKQRQ